MPLRNQNQFAPYREQIAELAHQGMNTREILETLGMEATKGKKEQLRRFLHSRNLPVAPQGAQPGEKHRDWNGGRFEDKDGYILLYKPDHPNARANGYILEHRYVMEQHIGRHLTSDEVVHHKNDDPSDNRIENLELFDSNAEHLQKTISGQVPDWSEEGFRRMRESASRYQQENPKPRDSRGRFASPDSLESDDPESQ